MTSALSQAFADTIAQGQVPPRALLTLMQAWPRDAWRADEGNPSPMEAVLRWSPTSGRPFDDAERHDWATLVERMVRDHTNASPAQQQAWMLDAVVTGQNSVLALKLWELIRPHATPRMTEATLARALELSWTPLVRALLAQGVSTDLSAVRPEFHPFMKVRTLDAFEALLTAGFDPFQPNAQGQDSVALLRARGADEPGGFISPQDRAAVMRRLTELGEALPASRRLDLVVRHGQRWTELQSELRALGDAAWDVRFDGGGTLLHHLALHKPAWIVNLFKWPGIKHAPDALFTTLDAHGLPALLYRWMATPVVDKSGSVVQGEQAWWDALRGLPATQRWTEGLPAMRPEQPLQALLDTAARLKRPLPSLIDPLLWHHLEALGGWSREQAKLAFMNDPGIQRRFDAVVWGEDQGNHVREVKHLGVINRWMDWDQAFRSINPWLANQYAMYALMNYSAGAAYDAASLLKNRLAIAFEAGASLGWVEDKLQRGWSRYRIGPTADPNQVWAHAKATEEQRLLRQELNGTAPAARPRSRL